MNASSPNLIAVCGKGGTGKTVLSAMLCKAFAESGRAGRLLIIDADPAFGLANAVGVKAPPTVGQLREAVIQTARAADSAATRSAVSGFDDQLLRALVHTEQFSFLAMGRTQTLGCFCPVNQLLRQAIESLSGDFDTILIDGEAGVEQISRQVVKRIRTMLVVTDATERGLQTAALVRHMLEDEHVLQYDRLALVLNRVGDDRTLLLEKVAVLGLDILGCIPADPLVAAYDLRGRPLLQLPEEAAAYQAVCQLRGALLP